MKKPAIKIIAILMCLWANGAALDTPLKTPAFNNQIGLAAGTTAGIGLSYRRWINNRFGVQVSGLFLSYTDTFINTVKDNGSLSGYSKIWAYNTGVLGLYSVKTWKRARGLLYMGASYVSQGRRDRTTILIDSVDVLYAPVDTAYGFNNFNEAIRIGNGFGIDLNLWHLSLNLMTGVHYGYSFSSRKFIWPTLSAEIGFFFCW
jgi:hypothetical protein